MTSSSAPAAVRADSLQALAPALFPHSPAGQVQIDAVRRLSGGASQETWSFDAHAPGQASLPLILRRSPKGAEARASMHAALDTEYALLELAHAAGVPVPRVQVLLQPDFDLGQGYVMQRLAGETLGRKIVVDARFAKAREQLAFQCGQALARIHAIPTARLPAVLREAPPIDVLGAFMAQHQSHGTVRPLFQLGHRWLSTNAPPPVAQPCLVHGDFRNGNLMVDEQGLAGVLDWELAHLGDPMEDLGWLCVNSWRYGGELPVGGFGSREQLFAGYEAGGGQVDAARVRYWETLGCLKWAVICEGMAHAFLIGAERIVDKAAIGRRSSEAELDLLMLLSPR